MRRASLRLRLFTLILTPLVLIAALLGYWRYNVAENTAEELFDRSLLSAALAISRDLAVSGGDALLPSTRDLIRDASGGEVFYHATGPGGIYVTGYAYPPPLAGSSTPKPNTPQFAEASYRGDRVRVLQVTEQVAIDGLTGDSTVTVWQRLADRNRFANQLAFRAAILLGVLLATLACLVWFGVDWGLRPLIDLEDAIAARSPDDLSQIKRAVPAEARGIVDTINRLFGRVETSITAHQVFISDAAHQLRNPAAAVQSMAEAVRDAPDETTRNQRIGELVSAARNSARVADQLLSLDRLQQSDLETKAEPVEVGALLHEVCAEMGPIALSRGIDFELDATKDPVTIHGDRLFLSEAIKNLIDNALKHGGATLSRIRTVLRREQDDVIITVLDDGKGLRPSQSEAAFGRFSQIEPSDGSGLGLAIVNTVAQRHSGQLQIDPVPSGTSISLHLPSHG